MIRDVGVLNSPPGSVEEISVEGNAQGQGNHNPLGQDGVLEALEDAADHAAADTVASQLAEDLVVGLADDLRQVVVDRGELEFVADRGKNCDDGLPAGRLGGLKDDIQAVGGNLEGVDGGRRDNTAEAAGPRGDVRDRVGAAEGDGAKVKSVDEEEARDHQDLELGNVGALDLAAKDGGARLVLAVSAGPVIALGDVLSNAAADTVVLEGLAHLDVALDAVDLELDAQDGGVEGEEQDAVEEEDPGGEEAELLQAALDARGSAENQDADLDGIVLDDAETLLLDGDVDGGLDDAAGYIALLGALGRSLLGPAVLDGVRQDGAGQDDVLLEADSDDQKRQALGEQDHGDGNAELGGDEQAEEEGKGRREKDAGGEPKVGAHAAHREEERDEGEVHRDVAEGHDDNVERLGVLEQVDKLNPAVADPAGDAAPGLSPGSLHDPHLLLAAVLGLAGLLRGDIVGDLLGNREELGGLVIGHGEGEGAVLGVGGK